MKSGNAGAKRGGAQMEPIDDGALQAGNGLYSLLFDASGYTVSVKTDSRGHPDE